MAEIATIEQQFEAVLTEIHLNRNDITKKKGIFIYGEHGSGKTHFVRQMLRRLNYDMIYYDSGDVRNKTLSTLIKQHNTNGEGILSAFNRRQSRLAIVMDEINGINTGDKGGLITLIRVLRPKKTKKQKQEDFTRNPIICINNCHTDKKIKELMRMCHVITFPSPTNQTIERALVCQISELMSIENLATNYPKSLYQLVEYVQQDMRKIGSAVQLWRYYVDHYGHNGDMADAECAEWLREICQSKKCSNNSKAIVRSIFDEVQILQSGNGSGIAEGIAEGNLSSLHHYLTYVSGLKPDDKLPAQLTDTDRITIGLFMHENIIDYALTPETYEKITGHFVDADYTDGATFQEQLWQFDEMNSMVRTYYSAKLLSSVKEVCVMPPPPQSELRFTKILTKRTTVHNNLVFVAKLCQALDMDKRDLYAYILKLDILSAVELQEEMNMLSENYGVEYLDIQRMKRYLAKYMMASSEGFIVGDGKCCGEGDCDDELDEFDECG